MRGNVFIRAAHVKKVKQKVGSSSYGAKRVRPRVWSGGEDGVSIAPVFSRSVLRGSLLALVRVGAYSPYRVSPTRLSSPSCACVRSLRGLCRLPPPGDLNARDCPGGLDERSRAAALNGTYGCPNVHKNELGKDTDMWGRYVGKLFTSAVNVVLKGCNAAAGMPG